MTGGGNETGADYASASRPHPLLWPVVAFALGIVLSEYWGPLPPPARWTAFSVPLLAAVALWRELTRPTFHGGAAVLLATLALSVGIARHQAAIDLAPNHVANLLADEPTLTRIAGRIVTQPHAFPPEKRNPYMSFDPPGRTRFTLAAEQLLTTDPPRPLSGLIAVSVKTDDIDVSLGQHVVLTGKLYRPRSRQNPGETDWAKWYRLQHIYAGMAIDGAAYVRIIDAPSANQHQLLATIRSHAQGLLFEPFVGGASDQSTRLLDAMVLGQRSAAGRKLNEAFLRTGGLHFLAVSGFHVGVLAGTFWLLVRYVFRRGRRTAAVVTLIAILLYALVVEHNAPVLRAATMAGLLCVAQLFRRPLCSLNWLALAALLILFYNPLELFRAGFQLSFLQVLALFTIVPHIYRIVIRAPSPGDVPADADSWPRLFGRVAWRTFAGLAVVCVCAWIIALPLVLYHFGRFTPWGALQSIIISPLVSLTISVGFLTLLANQLIPPLGVLLGCVLKPLVSLLLWSVDTLARLPGTLIEVAPPPTWLVLLSYGLLTAITVAWNFRAHLPAPDPLPISSSIARRNCGLTIATAVCFLAILWPAWRLRPPAHHHGDLTLHVLSVGNGAAILVVMPGGDTLLCDAGTIHNSDAGQTVTQAARTLGIDSLHTTTVSHANFDHYSGLATLLTTFPPNRILTGPPDTDDTEADALRELLEVARAQGIPTETTYAGQHIKIGGTTIDVLWPPTGLANTWEDNDSSLVLRIAANDRILLIPGDIEEIAMRGLLAQHNAGTIDLFADVLVAPHHGSIAGPESARFYEAVGPALVINSAVDERPKLIQTVTNTLGPHVPILSTHHCGAVTVNIDDTGRITVITPFAQEERRGD